MKTIFRYLKFGLNREKESIYPFILGMFIPLIIINTCFADFENPIDDFGMVFQVIFVVMIGELFELFDFWSNKSILGHLFSKTHKHTEKGGYVKRLTKNPQLPPLDTGVSFDILTQSLLHLGRLSSLENIVADEDDEDYNYHIPISRFYFSVLDFDRPKPSPRPKPLDLKEFS